MLVVLLAHDVPDHRGDAAPGEAADGVGELAEHAAQVAELQASVAEQRAAHAEFRSQLTRRFDALTDALTDLAAQCDRQGQEPK